jgi:hypothetical protein
MSLEQADRSVTEVIGAFAKHHLEVGLLVPTSNGMQKSIMDAHSGLREYFRVRGVHDYATQTRGPTGRRILNIWYVTSRGIEASKASLYRPETKDGDPRIWLYGLKDHARPGNVLALIAGDGGIYVLNASDPQFMAAVEAPSTPVGKLLVRLSPEPTEAAAELLGRLREISARGFVHNLRSGPTGVGYTLETLLGIRANNSKTPDYKGIELKAGRSLKSGRAAVRSNLFSKTPNWDVSAYSSLQLLKAYGQRSESGRLQINCTLTDKPNSTFGFYLQVEAADDGVLARKGLPAAEPTRSDQDIFRWDLAALRGALLAKHRETFWVKAHARGGRATEQFRYYEVVHTRGPLAGNLAPLIETGHVQVDFLMSLQLGKHGQERVRDHGYLFKLWEQDRHLLFAPPRTYSLLP